MTRARADAAFVRAYMNEGVVAWDANNLGRVHASTL